MCTAKTAKDERRSIVHTYTQVALTLLVYGLLPG